MSPLGFYTFLIFSALTVMGLFLPSPYLFTPAVFIFVGIPLIDFFVGENFNNPDDDQEKNWRERRVWAPALYFYSVTHFIVLGLGAFQVVQLQSSWGHLLSMAFIVGLYTGGLGITVAHELCHKKEKWPRFVANLLLASVWYQHFAVEHVRGHHLHVSTPEDPASARFNENVYSFLGRTLIGSFLHALKIDKAAVLKWVGVSIVLTVAAFLIDPKVMVYFLAQAVVAFILLELVNYVEHYGLSRKQLSNGRYEKVLPIHSWNSAHKFSNYLLFNLQRHSDHHALAHLPYTVLKHQDRAPQLPSGYPGMILLSLIPQVWFKVMNPKVEHWRQSYVTQEDS